MDKLLASDKVYISRSRIRSGGRGVYARINILKGEIIEQCPVVEIPKQDALAVNQSVLVTYIYYLGKNKDRLMLALGFGSIYNHSRSPNAKYKANLKTGLIDFIAINKINKNVEITVNYNPGDKEHKIPLWFE